MNIKKAIVLIICIATVLFMASCNYLPTEDEIKNVTVKTNVIIKELPEIQFYIKKTNMKEDLMLNVYFAEKDEVETMTLEDYIVGVVAAEMPASFNAEALSAQAVAARTYTARRIKTIGSTKCSKKENADVCTASDHCQAYAAVEEMQQNWGDEFEEKYKKIKQAVIKTKGVIMTYDGKPIESLYHSASGGKTEAVENVYAEALPYLKSVDSPLEEKNYYRTSVFSLKEFAETINDNFDEADITADLKSSDVKVLSRYESGRVEKLRVGNALITGTQMRKAFDLPSAHFYISIGTDVAIETYGFGHGVGMSQHGANKMAENGSDWREILSHYYCDVEFERIEDIAES